MNQTRTPSVLALAALYAAWKMFYTTQTDGEPWRITLFGVAAVGLSVLAAVGVWRRRQASSREAG